MHDIVAATYNSPLFQSDNILIPFRSSKSLSVCRCVITVMDMFPLQYYEESEETIDRLQGCITTPQANAYHLPPSYTKEMDKKPAAQLVWQPTRL
jgi:hypothetical protein